MLDDVSPNGLPLPSTTPDTLPFWESCRRHELTLQRCSQCEAFRFFPMVGCPFCGCEESAWQRVSGQASLYSWIVVHHASDATLRKALPYCVAVGELVEQAKLLFPARLVLQEHQVPRAEMKLEIAFDDVSTQLSLPHWRVA